MATEKFLVIVAFVDRATDKAGTTYFTIEAPLAALALEQADRCLHDCKWLLEKK